MDSATKAHIAISILAILPAITAYVWASYYDHFASHSWQQYLTLILTLGILFGVVPLQSYAYRAIAGMSKGDLYSRMIMILQYGAGLAIFFKVIFRREKDKTAKSGP